MSGNTKKVHDPTSLASWEEHNTVTVMFTDELGFKCRHIDILTWMNDQKGNPLLVIMQNAMKSGDNPLAQVDENDESVINGLSDIINKLLIEIVISPPLTEQGNDPDESLSLFNVSLAHKMKVFAEMTGGDQYDQMTQFPTVPASSVVDLPAGENVQ